MSSSIYNSKSPTIRRIREHPIPCPCPPPPLSHQLTPHLTVREAAELSTTPSPDYSASPLETDLFEWHFTLRGPPNSAFSSGIYHGRINLPPQYPHKPPSFRFMTPSGRFEPNREICLSISGHHEETWQPAWGIRTALVALRSFMETDPSGQLGGMDLSESARRKLAGESVGWRCSGCGGRTNGEVLKEAEEAWRAKEEEEGGGSEAKEVEVPSELKMGWRDEMGKKKEEKEEEDAESAELAEGFVKTGNVEAAAASVARIPTPAAAAAPAAAPALPPQPVPVRTQVQRTSAEDAVPLWVDRAIVLLCAALVAMLIKILFT